jgi:hypothetical protein
MSERKALTKRQRAVLNDLFAGELDEKVILERHKVRPNDFAWWLGEGPFVDEFNRRLDSSWWQCELILARYAPLAAAKLVQLTESDKEETARKACLDIIAHQLARHRRSQLDSSAGPAKDESQSPAADLQLSDETCSKLLAVLAQQSERV